MRKYLILIYTILAYFLSNLIIVFIIVYYNGNLNLKSIDIISEKYGNLYAFLVLVILGPIIEEIIFRWPLKYKLYKLQISIFIGAFYFFNGVFTFNYTLKGVLLSSVITIILFAITFLLDIKSIFNIKNLFYFNIISAVLFGFFHIKRVIGIDVNIFVFLYILPKIILGLFLNKIRLTLGMKFNIGIHMLINLIAGGYLLMKLVKF